MVVAFFQRAGIKIHAIDCNEQAYNTTILAGVFEVVNCEAVYTMLNPENAVFWGEGRAMARVNVR